MVKSLTACILALAVLVVVPVSSVWAVEDGAVGAKPAYPKADNARTKSIFIYTLKLGETASDGVKVVNTGSKTKSVHLYPVDGVLASGGTFSCAQEVEPRKDVGAWLKLSDEHVVVPGNGSVTVPFTVTVPAQADVGEHNGCVAIQEEDQKSATTGNGVALTFRTAIRVAVTIPGKIVKSLDFIGVTASKNEAGSVVVVPTIRNTGNVSLDTQLKTELSPIFGTAVSQDNGSYPILPRSTASWNLEIKSPFWGGLYRAKVTAAYNADPAAGIGAKNPDLKTLSSKSSLVVITPKPLAAAVEAAVVLALAAAVWWLLRRQRRSRHVRSKWRTYTVKEHDTIVKIAQHHGVAWKQLASANKLKAPYHIEAGQELKVPPKKEV
jgi:hypothetical protein